LPIGKFSQNLSRKITQNLLIMKADFDLTNLAFTHVDSLVKHLGIEFTEAGEGYLIARMPVDGRTHQPFGILHGGASVVLAESLGSVASWMLLDDPKTQQAVGLEINANHIRPVRSGWVYGRCTPIHIGRTTHIWDVRITDEAEKLVCISRLTVAIISRQ
jgi:1,4-dihydroxy-2-naphthoyl-CoA hydrolase